MRGDGVPWKSISPRSPQTKDRKLVRLYKDGSNWGEIPEK